MQLLEDQKLTEEQIETIIQKKNEYRSTNLEKMQKNMYIILF